MGKELKKSFGTYSYADKEEIKKLVLKYVKDGTRCGVLFPNIQHLQAQLMYDVREHFGWDAHVKTLPVEKSEVGFLDGSTKPLEGDLLILHQKVSKLNQEYKDWQDHCGEVEAELTALIAKEFNLHPDVIWEINHENLTISVETVTLKGVNSGSDGKAPSDLSRISEGGDLQGKPSENSMIHAWNATFALNYLLEVRDRPVVFLRTIREGRNLLTVKAEGVQVDLAPDELVKFTSVALEHDMDDIDCPPFEAVIAQLLEMEVGRINREGRK